MLEFKHPNIRLTPLSPYIHHYSSKSTLILVFIFLLPFSFPFIIYLRKLIIPSVDEGKNLPWVIAGIAPFSHAGESSSSSSASLPLPPPLLVSGLQVLFLFQLFFIHKFLYSLNFLKIFFFFLPFCMLLSYYSF